MQPAAYLLVHPLPSAPHFVGRDSEQAELRALWQGGFRGVVALVGLGGAGKTALAAKFLADRTAASVPSRPERLFLWSFYQEPDTGLFLESASAYFAVESATAAKGAGLLNLLAQALSEGGPHWLVLDGLERVQCQETTSTETYGQIEDPLLKSLLARIAEGLGQTVVLVTSRFPLADLQSFLGRGYRHIDVGGLSRQAAVALLRHRGVNGEDAILGDLVDSYGAHALTLDHLGGLIGQFLDGNPYRAPELADLAPSAKDRQGFRLARLLRAYEDHLPPTELALLCRLCLLRRSVTEEHVQQFFLCSPPVNARMIREVSSLIQRFPGFEKHFHPDLALDLALAIRAVLEESLCTATLAGPEETFSAEVRLVAEKILQLHEADMELEFGELARLYADPALDNPTDLRPLSSRDRQALRSLYARYAGLSEHPLTPFHGAVPSALEQAFKELGFARTKPPRVQPELGPADIWEGLRDTKRGLRYLAGKHFALRRVRELCRVHQRKWSLAGPLAALDAAGMHQVLEALVGRHLIVREADGSFSVHPAVRDHFYRLASAGDQGAWHDILREQLVTLVQRPGRRQPQDRATLDLVEEAIYHALEAARTDEAVWLYQHVLGGIRHLGWKLGEMARGLRVLRSFNPCPEPWDLGWYLRALGEFDQAFAANPLPYFRADILLLQGRLPRVAGAGDSTRTPVADFLMGKTTTLPPDQLGSAIPREQLLLYLGRLDRVCGAAGRDRFYRDIGWEADRARCQLLLAEATRRQGNDTACRGYLDAAAVWILHSGSLEHLCLLHLVQARADRARYTARARRHVAEGLHIARHSGLGLFHIELLCEQADILLAGGAAATAEQSAREALHRASAVDCQFLWGAAQAGHLLGRTLLAQNHLTEARAFLQKTLDLRRRIGDPGAEDTERLL